MADPSADPKSKTKETTVALGVPYLNAYGNITKALDRIQTASTPPRFTQDFLATKLALPGGSAKPIIPFLKRVGFLQSDGTPTELYRQFRNPKIRGAAAAKALRNGYAPLYELNEYLHDASDKDLRGVVVQATGLQATAPTVKAIVGSFKALRAVADFEAAAPEEDGGDENDAVASGGGNVNVGKIPASNLRLGYTIHLNLPATSDIAVFNAIFKSLREHLID